MIGVLVWPDIELSSFTVDNPRPLVAQASKVATDHLTHFFGRQKGIQPQS